MKHIKTKKRYISTFNKIRLESDRMEINCVDMNIDDYDIKYMTKEEFTCYIRQELSNKVYEILVTPIKVRDL